MDALEGGYSFVPDPRAALAAAEVKLIKALSSVADHALGQMCLEYVCIATKRAAQGIAECEHALALDRNLVNAHSLVGLGKIFVGRAEETEAHVVEALRLSPPRFARVPLDDQRRPREAPPRELGGGGRVVSTGDRGQPKSSECAFLVGGRHHES